ncbi:DUF4276 family protein [Saprospira grandis]|uniref:DUF4276 family protein n=1 Tax=Saprospira grandis TaxID=1008 RepID=UPI0022DDBE7F|nr:DUF4276 family protein [Saprospira grandis]WBM73379.1 DUF4276 family protein [Saprospira grandis]
MEYLIIILAAEGPTDYRFLKPLLERYLSQLDLRRPIELQIEEVTKNTGGSFSDYLAKIDTKAEEYAANFIVLHQDADANELSDKNQQIKDRWAAQSSAYSLVAAIPVKMIEAWLLADPILLLEKGLGEPLPKKPKDQKQRLAELGLSHPPESIVDPKAFLSALIGKLLGPKEVNETLSDLYNLLGNQLSFDALKKRPSFRAFDQQMKKLLTDQQLMN